MNFSTEFVGADESPLSESSAFTAGQLDRGSNRVIGGDASAIVQTTAAKHAGVAMLSSPAAQNRDQHVRIVATCLEEQNGSLTIITVGDGSSGVLTFSGAHGRTGWGYLTLSGITETTSPQTGLDLNTTWLVDFDTATNQATIIGLALTGTTFEPTASPSTATAVPADCYIDLFSRVPSTSVVASASTDFTPDRGYVFRLSYENGGVRKLRFLRYDFGSAGTLRELAVSADIASSLVTSNGSPETNIGIGQDLRFIVQEVRGGRVKLRGYINNLDNESPDLEFTDKGDDTGSASSAPISMARTAGVPGFHFWSEKTVAAYFAASDYAEEELEGLQFFTPTLATVRARVKTRAEGSTTSNFPDSLYNQWIEEAQDEIIEDLGNMAFFMRRTEQLTLASEETGPNAEIRFTMGRNVKTVEEVRSTTTGDKLDWRVHSLQDGGRLKIELATGQGGTPYEITYFARTPKLSADTDNISIPPEHLGVLIELAVVKYAQYHSDAALERSAMDQFARKLSILKNSMSRFLRQNRGQERFRGPRRGRVSRYVPAYQIWGDF